jgi:hypothetical protein
VPKPGLGAAEVGVFPKLNVGGCDVLVTPAAWLNRLLPDLLSAVPKSDLCSPPFVDDCPCPPKPHVVPLFAPANRLPLPAPDVLEVPNREPGAAPDEAAVLTLKPDMLAA